MGSSGLMVRKVQDYECYVDLISMLQMTEKQAYFWHVATISFHT